MGKVDNKKKTTQKEEPILNTESDTDVYVSKKELISVTKNIGLLKAKVVQAQDLEVTHIAETELLKEKIMIYDNLHKENKAKISKLENELTLRKQKVKVDGKDLSKAFEIYDIDENNEAVKKKLEEKLSKLRDNNVTLMKKFRTELEV